MNISKKITYERLENGVDVYTLKTSTKDVVICKIALPGGTHTAYSTPTLALLLDEMLPGGTKNREKDAVLDAFETLGARVHIRYSNDYLILSLTSRSKNFLKALTLLIDVIVEPSLRKKEYDVAVHKVRNTLEHLQEETQYIASETLKQTLFRRGHPHWTPPLRTLQKELSQIANTDIRSFYKKTLTGIGAQVVIVGDVDKNNFQPKVAKIVRRVPAKIVDRYELHPEKLRHTQNIDHVVTLRDKFNVDTCLGIPLTITASDSDYFTFLFGVSILGSSSTSRLFNIMRTRKNLTYGAQAHIVGSEGGYPPYLNCRTILPNRVFQKGRQVLRDVVRDFVDMGVTGKEIQERKEDVIGKYAIILSTSSGLCSEIFTHVLQNRPLRDIDTFTEKIQSMTTKKVNTAIQSHIDFALAKTAAAGAVRADGTPI